MSIFSRHTSTLPTAAEALPGRTSSEFHIADRHRVLDAPVVTPTAPEGYDGHVTFYVEVPDVEAALQKAIEDPAVKEKMSALGLQTSYLSGADYEKFWAGQEEDFKKALPLVQKKN